MRLPTVKPTFLDRVVSRLSPGAGLRRLRDRARLDIATELFSRGGYDGARRDKRGLKSWQTFGNDADSDILPDLTDLRERSRDLSRNNPIACGAIKTKITNVIGTGLNVRSHIDRDFLGMTDEQADAWEKTTDREWSLFWESKDLDIARTLNGPAFTKQLYQQEKENGDVFVAFPRRKVPGRPYTLRLQMIEADRVENKDNAPETDTHAGGILKDEYGAPIEYQVLKKHPGSIEGKTYEWVSIPAFGLRTGLRNVIHFYHPTRPGQTRGVPDLAPVIEALRQLGEYTNAELMAAVISGMFSVFIETDSGAAGFDYTNLDDETGQNSSDKDYKLGYGMITELASGEKVHDSNPGRPNTNYDPFVNAIIAKIGAAIEIPYEVLIKRFNSSYSAARAALISLWKYALSERKFVGDEFIKPVREIWMHEAVSSGRIVAPGFFVDPALRAAYLECSIVGPSKGQINESVEVKAAADRVNSGFSTIEYETAQMTGESWERNHTQQVKERNKRKADGLITENTGGNSNAGNNNPT